MQMRSESRLLMMVSMATWVLPVWRSPMISSRWPRPMATIESIAFSPVDMGSSTGWGSTTPRPFLLPRLPLDAARRLELGRPVLVGVDVSLAVQRLAQLGADALEHGFSERDLE